MKPVLLLSMLLACAIAGAQTPFTPGSYCSSIHCGQLEDDQLGVVPPLANFGLLWADTNSSLSSTANVGAVTNGTTIAVTYATGNTTGGPCPGGSDCSDPTTYVYTPTLAGNFASWNTGSLGTSPIHGMCSAPLIGSDGGVVQADEHYIERFGPGGTVVWGPIVLPYYGVGSNANSAGHYACGSIKYFSDTGNLAVASINGPYALFNGSTGAIIGPAGCSSTPGACATWPGISGSPGVGPGTSDFWVSQKEGGAAYCPASGACTLYKSSQWTGCENGETNPPAGGSCTVTNGISASGALIAMSETTTGLALNYISEIVNTTQYASPMVHVISGTVYIYGDQGSNPPSGTLGQAMVWIDNGTALNVAPGFPVTTATITGR